MSDSIRDLICPHCLRATNAGGLKLYDPEDTGMPLCDHCDIYGVAPITPAQSTELAKQLNAWVKGLKAKKAKKKSGAK